MACASGVPRSGAEVPTEHVVVSHGVEDVHGGESSRAGVVEGVGVTLCLDLEDPLFRDVLHALVAGGQPRKCAPAGRDDATPRAALPRSVDDRHRLDRQNGH